MFAPLHAIPICLLPPAPGWAERLVRDIAVVLAAPVHDKSTGNHKGALSPAVLPSLKGWALSVRALCIFKEQEQLQAQPRVPWRPHDATLGAETQLRALELEPTESGADTGMCVGAASKGSCRTRAASSGVLVSHKSYWDPCASP